MDTPVQPALNEAIERGVPMGGTSAGLAVQGEFVYSAQGDAPDDKDLSSEQTLVNPYHPRVTIVHAFLKNPLLKDVITDTHFAARDRMGRTLVFMSRTLEDGRAREIRAIAVDERTSVLLDPDGQAVVAGAGHAYFLRSTQRPEICEPGAPLTFRGVAARSLVAGQHFDVGRWRSSDGIAYTLGVENGVVRSSLPAVGLMRGPSKKLGWTLAWNSAMPRGRANLGHLRFGNSSAPAREPLSQNLSK